jgi:hypothetical protein
MRAVGCGIAAILQQLTNNLEAMAGREVLL